MNPEAGLIQGPFREAVTKISREHPELSADDVFRLARGEPAIATTAQRTAEPIHHHEAQHQLQLI